MPFTISSVLVVCRINKTPQLEEHSSQMGFKLIVAEFSTDGNGAGDSSTRNVGDPVRGIRRDPVVENVFARDLSNSLVVKRIRYCSAFVGSKFIIDHIVSERQILKQYTDWPVCELPLVENMGMNECRPSGY